MSCLACNGHMAPWLKMPIDAKKDELTPYNTFTRCIDCGLGQMDPLPPVKAIPALYNLSNYYTQGSSHIRNVPPSLFDKILVKLAWWTDRPKPFAVPEMCWLLPRDAHVLDIGCGDGVLLEAFRRAGATVAGVDPDPVCCRLASEKGLQVLEGTAENLPAEVLTRTYDLVIMSHSLEHCIDPGVAMRNISKILKPKGYAYFEVPNAGCLHFADQQQTSEMFDSPRHLWFFTPESLRKTVERNGLKYLDWRYAGYTRHFSSSWRGWETEIANRLRRRGIRARGNGVLRAASLLVRSAFAPPLRKYDCIGVLAAPADAR